MSYSYDDNGLRPGSDVHVHTSGGGGGRLAIIMGAVLIFALIAMGAAGIRSFGPEAKARAEVIVRTPVPTPTPMPEVVQSQTRATVSFYDVVRWLVYVGGASLAVLVVALVLSWSWRRREYAAQRAVQQLHRTNPSLISGWDEVYDPLGSGTLYLGEPSQPANIEHAQLVAQNFSAAAAWKQVVSALIQAQKQRQLSGPECTTLERGLTRLEQLESGQ